MHSSTLCPNEDFDSFLWLYSQNELPCCAKTRSSRSCTIKQPQRPCGDQKTNKHYSSTVLGGHSRRSRALNGMHSLSFKSVYRSQHTQKKPAQTIKQNVCKHIFPTDLRYEKHQANGISSIMCWCCFARTLCDNNFYMMNTTQMLATCLCECVALIYTHGSFRGHVIFVFFFLRRLRWFLNLCGDFRCYRQSAGNSGSSR